MAVKKITIPVKILVDLLEQGYQCSRIADKLNYSQPTIRRICKELDLDGWLKNNGKEAQVTHNRSIRWVHGDRSRRVRDRSYEID